MRLHIRHAISALLVSILAAQVVPAQSAARTVFEASEKEVFEEQDGLMFMGALSAKPHIKKPGGYGDYCPNAMIKEPTILNRFFKVYDAPTVDSRIAQSLDTRVNPITDEGGTIDTRIRTALEAAELRFNSQVLTAINGIPETLKTDTVLAAVKLEILTTIRGEMRLLEEKLQNQIDALKDK